MAAIDFTADGFEGGRPSGSKGHARIIDAHGYVRIRKSGGRSQKARNENFVSPRAALRGPTRGSAWASASCGPTWEIKSVVLTG